MKQTDRCEYCGHELLWHSGACTAPSCDCQAFVPHNQQSEQTIARKKAIQKGEK